MEATLRQPTPADVRTLGRIHYEAFRGIEEPHGFWNPAFINLEASILNAAELLEEVYKGQRLEDEIEVHGDNPAPPKVVLRSS